MVKPIGGRVCVTPLANAFVCHERKRVQGGTESRQTFASRSGDAKHLPVSRAHAVRERANARFINPYRKRRLHFQNEMVFAEIDKAFVTHFAQFRRQPAALDSEIIRKLLS